MAAASGVLAPPLALLLGIAYGFAFVHPLLVDARRLSKLLLQASVVGLGFGMNLHQVIQAGRSGLVYPPRGSSGMLVVSPDQVLVTDL